MNYEEAEFPRAKKNTESLRLRWFQFLAKIYKPKPPTAWDILRTLGYKQGHIKGTQIYYVSKKGKIVTEFMKFATFEDSLRALKVYAENEIKRLGRKPKNGRTTLSTTGNDG